ncbi:MAG: hypothetical protein U9O98_03505, partial [Asgard group archaeon]|nr:hypothetical protein [Asgard group archaeon]
KVPYFLAYFYAWLKELFTPPSKEVLITRTRVKRYGSYRLVNISKIQEQLQWHPQFTNPFESISNSVEWLKDNGYLSIP